MRMTSNRIRMDDLDEYGILMPQKQQNLISSTGETTTHNNDTTLLKFKIGIVIYTTRTRHRSIRGISNPASSCRVTSLVVLKGNHTPGDQNNYDNDNNDDDDSDNDDDNNKNNNNNNNMNCTIESSNGTKTNDDEDKAELKAWLIRNHLNNEGISVLWDENGFKDVLSSKDVDALYVILPIKIQRPYVLAALQSGKHVIVSDQIATSLPEFIEQLEHARRYKKFIQFSTTLVQNYRVQVFMDYVLHEQNFGRIHNIDAEVKLNYKNLSLVGVSLPLGEHDSSIARLGRYCVLFGTLLFMRVGSHAISAQVIPQNMVKTEDSRLILSASCIVNFTKNRTLKFLICYTEFGVTRQSLKVDSDSTQATMTDFVFPNRDARASYRVYKKKKEESCEGQIQIGSGRAVDVAGGPPQDVMMWRTFSQLSRLLDKATEDESGVTAETEELANVALQTKIIMSALMKSIENNNVEVPLDEIKR